MPCKKISALQAALIKEEQKLGKTGNQENNNLEKEEVQRDQVT